MGGGRIIAEFSELYNYQSDEINDYNCNFAAYKIICRNRAISSDRGSHDMSKPVEINWTNHRHVRHCLGNRHAVRYRATEDMSGCQEGRSGLPYNVFLFQNPQTNKPKLWPVYEQQIRPWNSQSIKLLRLSRRVVCCFTSISWNFHLYMYLMNKITLFQWFTVSPLYIAVPTHWKLN